MKKFLLFLAIALSVFCGYSQDFDKFYGGTLFESIYSIQQTTDGGYICSGHTNSNNGDVTVNHGGHDCWVLKLSNSGSIQWQRSIGGTGGETAVSILQTTDGGYIFTGSTSSNDGDITNGNHGGNDCLVVKLSNTGSIQWQRSLGGTGLDLGFSIVQTSDGGYAVAAFSNSNNGDVTGNPGGYKCWVVKLTSAGLIQWQKPLGPDLRGTWDPVNEFSMRQTTDRGYIIAGSVPSAGNSSYYDCWIIKLTDTGSIQWQKFFGGSDDDHAYSIQQTTDGGYIFGGSSRSMDGDVIGNNGNYGCWIVKLTNTGTIQWQKSLGKPFPLSETARSVRQTADGGYLIGGRISVCSDDYPYPCDDDLWVIKLSDSGAVQWEQIYDTDNQDERLYSVELTADGGYIIAADSNDAGTGNHGGFDGMVIKRSNMLSTSESTLENLFNVYPNPINNELHVNINGNNLDLPYVIYDQSGRSVIKGNLSDYKNIIKTGNLSRGVYILSIGDKTKTTKKIIKE